jgi:hypothetical protein
MADPQTSDVAWAYQLNARWIVHHGLDKQAKAYMEHLARIDPKRLERSCRLAHQLVGRAPREDPKPWFYAGLFSLATFEEAREFLANHWFTVSAIPSLPAEICPACPKEPIGRAARDKIARIRQALSSLLASSDDRG